MSDDRYISIGNLEQHLAEREEAIKDHVDVGIDPIHDEESLEGVQYEFDRLKKLLRHGRIGQHGKTDERLVDAADQVSQARDMIDRCAAESTGPPREELGDASHVLDEALSLLEAII